MLRLFLLMLCVCLTLQAPAAVWAQVVADAAPEMAAPVAGEDGWVSLFNGENLDGWKASEHTSTFSVQEGAIKVEGDRSHLFYEGEVNDHDFTNFEWYCEIMTKPNANSGMYFHTEFQEVDWPGKGYEVQVNNTHGDPKKTGGLYDVADVLDVSPAQDNEWFTQHVIVQGKNIRVYVNGKLTTDYTEPEGVDRQPGRTGRKLSHGTIALQGHDPGSVVMYRKVLVKPLP